MLASDERSVKDAAMSDPREFSERFRKQRLKLGLTLEQVAQRLDLAWQSVSAWEKGGMPRPHRFEAVARALETTVEELFYGQERKAHSGVSESQRAGLPVLQTRSAVPIIGLRDRVPVISWSLAGSWRSAQKDFHPGDAEGWLYVTGGNVGEGAFAVRVTGDAMANTSDRRNLPDGALVAIDPERKVEHDRVVLAKKAGHTMLRLFWLDGDTPYLKPLNEKYPMLDATDAEIIGVAFQATKDL
jgi:SOS-response transcriptional repressor LexA